MRQIPCRLKCHRTWLRRQRGKSDGNRQSAQGSGEQSRHGTYRGAVLRLGIARGRIPAEQEARQQPPHQRGAVYQTEGESAGQPDNEM